MKIIFHRQIFLNCLLCPLAVASWALGSGKELLFKSSLTAGGLGQKLTPLAGLRLPGSSKRLAPRLALPVLSPHRGDRAGDGAEGARAAAGLSVLAGLSKPEPSVAGSWLLWVVLFLFFSLFLALREKPQFKGFLKT